MYEEANKSAVEDFPVAYSPFFFKSSGPAPRAGMSIARSFLFGTNYIQEKFIMTRFGTQPPTSKQ